jgi:pilus assembly protein Flp/PilA
MTWILVKLATLKQDRRGVTALEYGLIASLVAVVIISAVTTLGTNLKSTFNVIANHFVNGNAS